MKNLFELVKQLHSYEPWVPSNSEQSVFSKQVSSSEVHFATWDENFSPSKLELDNVAVAVNLDRLNQDHINSAFDMYYSDADLSDLKHEEIEFLKAEAYFQTYIQPPVLIPENETFSPPQSMGF